MAGRAVIVDGKRAKRQFSRGLRDHRPKGADRDNSWRKLLPDGAVLLTDTKGH